MAASESLACFAGGGLDFKARQVWLGCCSHCGRQGGRLVGCRPLSSSVSSIDRQPKSDGSWLDEKGEPCPDVAVSSISQVDQAAIYAPQLPTSV